VVVSGVSGSGKTTVGRALAAALDVPFADADDLHPRANVAKMSAGTPLDEDDRRPWLEAIATWLAAHSESGGVVACSALRRSYRDVLAEAAPDVWILHLDVARDVLVDRLQARRGHFMPATLLESQLALLEPPGDDERVVTIDASTATPEDVVRRFLTRVRED
jgi:gluconokinase